MLTFFDAQMEPNKLSVNQNTRSHIFSVTFWRNFLRNFSANFVAILPKKIGFVFGKNDGSVLAGDG